MSSKVEKSFYESENFEICLLDLPHVDRKEDGHIFIRAKNYLIKDRTMLDKEMAHEFIEL